MQPGDEEPKQTEETQEEVPKEEGQEEEKPADEGEEAEPGEEEARGEEAGKDSEGEEGAAAKSEESAPDPEEKRKRAGGWQRKIDRLERMNQQLVEQLTTQRPGQSQGGEPPKETTPEDKAAAYIDNLVEQKIVKREQERQAQAAQAEFNRRTAEVRAKHPDYEEAIESVRHIPVHNEVNAALLTSEHGAEIMYQLATNPAELSRLRDLPPLVAVMEIGKLAAKLAAAAPTSAQPKSALRPPAPPTTVNGKSSSTRSMEDLPISDYKRAYRSGRR